MGEARSTASVWTSLLYDVAGVLASMDNPERRVDRALAIMGGVLVCNRTALWEVSPVLARPITTLPPVTEVEAEALAKRLSDLARLLSEVPPHRPSTTVQGNAYLSVPLIGAGEVIAILHVERFEGSFDDVDLAMVSGVAALLGPYLTLVRARRDLRESERRFRTLYESADAIISIDNARRIVLYNRGAETIFGYTSDEMLGQPLDVLLPGRFRASHRKHVERFAQGPQTARLMGERPFEILGRRKSGEEFPAEAAISKLESEGATFLTVMLRDTTERSRREREQRFLAEVGAALASTLDQAETLTSIAGLAVREIADCCVVDVVDHAGRRRLKIAIADPAKAALAHLLETNALDSERPYLMRSAVETRQPMLLADVPPDYLTAGARSPEHLRALRELGPTSIIVVPLVAHARVLGALALVSTRPEHRYGPHDLRLAQDLAQLAGLAIENASLYRATQDAINARDEVLGVVAHDLRNPLSAIHISAQMLRDHLACVEDAEPMVRLIDMIRRSVQRADRLIEDLLDVHRMEVGQLSLESAEVRAAPLVHEVVESQQPLAAGASLELRAEAPDETPPVWADRGRLMQVLENLIGNAVKFTPQGGRITVSVEDHGAAVRFRVADTGQGIAPDQLPHLFDRFWQAERTDRRGAGLGLAICKGIVEAHGGRIWAESAPGAGTTFFFTIPKAGSSCR